MTGIFNESSNPSFFSLNHLSSLPSASLNSDSSDFYQVINEGKLKKFTCNFPACQKTFRFKSEIERHLSAHSGLRPHSCKYPGCKKSFKRIDALDDHVRSQHTGEAPLMCPYPDCGQRFSTTAKLRYHSALHEDQKPYRCGVSGCERGFVTLSQLRQHEKSTLAHRRLGLTPDRKRSGYSQSPQGNYYEEEQEEDQDELIAENNKRFKLDVVIPERYDGHFFAQRGLPKHVVHEAPQEIVHNVSHVNNHQLTYENIKLDEPPVEKKEFLTNVMGENECLKKRLNYTESMIHAMKGQLDKVMLLLPNKFDHMKLLGYKQEGANQYFDGNNIPEGMMPEVDNFFF